MDPFGVVLQQKHIYICVYADEMKIMEAISNKQSERKDL